MTPEEFAKHSLPPGQSARLWLDVAPMASGAELRLPLFIARGTKPGPTVTILGGVHGDEYEGMAACRAVFAGLEPASVSGTVVGIPVCNPLAFAEHARSSVIDGLNLARVFPGRADGSITERIADAITRTALSRTDFLIDLHSSGSYIEMPFLVGCRGDKSNAADTALAAARAFGAPVIWRHPTTAPGRTISVAQERGIPWLYTESPSGGWLHRDLARRYCAGTLNVLRHLGVLPPPVQPVDSALELDGDGDTDRSIAAPVAGFLNPLVDLLQTVAAGDPLGEIVGLDGGPLADLPAPSPGRVMLIRRAAPVNAGDIVFMLT